MDSPCVIEVPIVILVDGEGNFAIGADKDEAFERYAENWQDPLCLRCVLATVMIEKPKPVKIRGDVPAEAVDVRFKAIESI